MIDIENEIFPFCIVWTTLPFISCIFPFIGHVGICSSQGIVSDFVGYHINYRKLSFNRPIKYVLLDISEEEEYDHAIMDSNQYFENQAHDFCCNNCHHHVADILNRISYKGRNNWGQIQIWWLCISNSTYVRWHQIIKLYLPLVIIAGLICLIVYLIRS